MRGHTVGEKEPAKRALVVFRQSCDLLSHKRAPPSYELGPSDPLGARGTQLLSKFGHWAGRRLSAH